MKGDWRDLRRILCVRLDNLGDVLMTTPALRALKESIPEAHLTLLASPAGAAAAPFIPEVDEVLCHEAPWVKSTLAQDSAADDRLIAELRRHEFDGAVIFTVYSQSPLPAALLCYLARIPRRLAHCRENPYHLLTNWIPETEPEQRVRHEVQRQLDLVGAVGCTTRDTSLSFRCHPNDQALVLERLRSEGIDPAGRLVLLHPGATAPSRRYPPDYFSEVARCLAQDPCLQVVFTGSTAEVPLIEQIRQRMGAPSRSFAGMLSLGELGALIGFADLLVANNTGPVHVAAALGTPVVDLYALTNPQHTPWRVPHRVLFHDVACKYCYKSICPQGHHDCLRGVLPERVVRASRALLARRSRFRPGLSPAVASA